MAERVLLVLDLAMDFARALDDQEQAAADQDDVAPGDFRIEQAMTVALREARTAA